MGALWLSTVTSEEDLVLAEVAGFVEAIEAEDAEVTDEEVDVAIGVHGAMEGEGEAEADEEDFVVEGATSAVEGETSAL